MSLKNDIDIKSELAARRKYVLIQMAKIDFWEYCKVRHPDFYIESRPHLKKYCKTLQLLYERKLLRPNGKPYLKIIIRMPPQHGKTRTLILFEEWCFGQNPKEKIITCSYNDSTAYDFSKYVRDGILEIKNTQEQIVFSDIFPGIKIKKGTGAVEKWAIEGNHFSYIGAGIGGSLTSKGGSIKIIDDSIKNAEEAFNQNRLKKIWQWYTGTFLSRNEPGGNILEIICATPWCAGDIQNRILLSIGKDEWYVLNMPAYENKKMLCDDFLSFEQYTRLKRDADELIFSANYDLKIIESKFLLYKPFTTYTEFPRDEQGRVNYTAKVMVCDTADTGEDYLCAIYGLIVKNLFYVFDIYYTQADISVTENDVADRLLKYKINVAYIESNSAGHSFAYHTEQILKTVHKWHAVTFMTFTQSKNKETRIFSLSSEVNRRIIMPDDWKYRFPDFYQAVMTFQRQGKNLHDDAPDTLTICVEYMDNQGINFDDLLIKHEVT